MYDQLTVLAPASACVMLGFGGLVGAGLYHLIASVRSAHGLALATGVADSKAHMETTRVLTPNEADFLNRLERAAPGNSKVLAQVSMAAILRTTLTPDDPRYFETRRQFSSKIVDFVILDVHTGKARLVVELDDRMHDGAKDARRDRIVKAAGLSTLRFQSTAKPTITELRLILADAVHGQRAAVQASAASAAALA